MFASYPIHGSCSESFATTFFEKFEVTVICISLKSYSPWVYYIYLIMWVNPKQSMVKWNIFFKDLIHPMWKRTKELLWQLTSKNELWKAFNFHCEWASWLKILRWKHFAVHRESESSCTTKRASYNWGEGLNKHLSFCLRLIHLQLVTKEISYDYS